MEIAEKIKPFSCCIVPEKREEITTEGGLNLLNNYNKLKPMITKLKDIGVRTTLFIDPDDVNLDACYDLKIDCAEIHCGTLCKLYEENDPRRDSGFTIFYIGINIGALLATTVVAYIGETYGFKYGFGLAGLGMLLGLFIFWFVFCTAAS